jgi:hypothetical protein
MPGQPVHLLKLFIASPGDVALERDKACEEIDNLRLLAHKHGYDLEAVRWEAHATPGMGRGQELINRLVRECDLFIGILYRRFGLPTGEAESGTLEEFDLARERFAKERAPEIMLYFREVHPDFLADPGDQLKKEMLKVKTFFDDLFKLAAPPKPGSVIKNISTVFHGASTRKRRWRRWSGWGRKGDGRENEWEKRSRYESQN